MVERKVFCIGFQKTGTTSLRDAFRQMDYRYHGPYGRDWSLKRLEKEYKSAGLAIAQEHDVVADMPWPLIYRELDEAFPGSRFILTLRDTDNWYRSIRNHFGDRPAPLQELTYGADAGAPVGNEQRYREVYDNYNAEVQDYFANRDDDLLIMHLEDGDGWDALARFLGRDDLPTGPFVRTNTAGERMTLKNRLRKRVRSLFG